MMDSLKKHPRYDKTTKFAYSRPEFLQLKTDDEIFVSADHLIRPIILPRDSTRLPWNTGYAECINAGKSPRNEDQAASFQDVILRNCSLLESKVDPTKSITIEDQLPWFYFALFDGHAGPAVAVTAAAQLHDIIRIKLNQISDLLFALGLDNNDHLDESCDETEDVRPIRYRDTKNYQISDTQLSLPRLTDFNRHNITVDSLIKGVLESAFWEMDAIIGHDKQNYQMAGGCTALVSLFILGKVYVCNAGDSRAIISKGVTQQQDQQQKDHDRVIEMSYDFTPITERQRLLRMGMQRPQLLGNEYTHLQFPRRPTRKDLGKQMLYKDAYMTGWSMKTITYDDLKVPLVWGEGKRSRLLATIGVTRGFGDHELKATYGGLFIKPFLTCEPEVKIYNLEDNPNLTADDVLIMGTDGLWDNVSNLDAAHIVQESFNHSFSHQGEESRSKYRFVTAAQDLVIHSRGYSSAWKASWRTEDGFMASPDDISVFVIPLKKYKDDYLEWLELRKKRFNTVSNELLESVIRDLTSEYYHRNGHSDDGKKPSDDGNNICDDDDDDVVDDEENKLISLMSTSVSNQGLAESQTPRNKPEDEIREEEEEEEEPEVGEVDMKVDEKVKDEEEQKLHRDKETIQTN